MGASRGARLVRGTGLVAAAAQLRDHAHDRVVAWGYLGISGAVQDRPGVDGRAVWPHGLLESGSDGEDVVGRVPRDVVLGELDHRAELRADVRCARVVQPCSVLLLEVCAAVDQEELPIGAKHCRIPCWNPDCGPRRPASGPSLPPSPSPPRRLGHSPCTCPDLAGAFRRCPQFPTVARTPRIAGGPARVVRRQLAADAATARSPHSGSRDAGSRYGSTPHRDAGLCPFCRCAREFRRFADPRGRRPHNAIRAPRGT